MAPLFVQDHIPDLLPPTIQPWYSRHMTREQIETVLERVRSWPAARQEDAVRLLLSVEAQDTATYILSHAERADLEAALDEAARDEVASDAEVEAVLARHRG